MKPATVVGEKLNTVQHRFGKTGAPILDEAIAYLECEVREIANHLGDHAVVIGEVVEAGARDKEAAALEGRIDYPGVRIWEAAKVGRSGR